MGPYAVYSDMVGNRGLTAVTIIETSHIAMHVWDEVSPALMQLDVYTCSTLNTADVFAALAEFVPHHVEFTYIDREHNLTLLDKGTVNEVLSIST
jgi:S-adenosylmethionine/arginine decarboxylase-like enzyme